MPDLVKSFCNVEKQGRRLTAFLNKPAPYMYGIHKNITSKPTTAKTKLLIIVNSFKLSKDMAIHYMLHTLTEAGSDYDQCILISVSMTTSLMYRLHICKHSGLRNLLKTCRGAIQVSHYRECLAHSTAGYKIFIERSYNRLLIKTKRLHIS